MRVQFGKLRRESSLCVLCGNLPADTREHIPPQSIFLKKPQPYLVVPACKRCNESTKLDDEFLRQFMSAGSWTPEGREVWSKKVASKFPRFPATRVGLKNRLNTISIRLPELGFVPVQVILAEKNRINRVVRKMVRGLFWFHGGHLLPTEVSIYIQMWNVAQVRDRFNDPKHKRVFCQTGLGLYRDPEVMKTFFYHWAIDGDRSLWYFFFYRQNVLVAYAGDLDEEGKRRETRHHGSAPDSSSRYARPTPGGRIGPRVSILRHPIRFTSEK